MSKKIDLTASWTYHSGDMMTLPMMIDQFQGGIAVADGRNNYRIPAYHRLDLGMNFHLRKWRSPERYGEWSFSVYNAYNRMNIFLLYADNAWVEGNEWYRPKLRKLTLFPVLPSISYTYNF